MPRKRTRRMKGGSYLTTAQIETGTRNLNLIKKLLSAKPPLQQPGQLYRPLQQYGGNSQHYKNGSLVDRYNAYVYIPNP
jgi:hypothetical protein